MSDAEMQQAAMTKALASLAEPTSDEERERLAAFNASNQAWREMRTGKRCQACGGESR